MDKKKLSQSSVEPTITPQKTTDSEGVKQSKVTDTNQDEQLGKSSTKPPPQLNDNVDIKQKNEILLHPYSDWSLDIVFYRAHYLDLKKHSENELRSHWTSYGKKEGRYPNEKAFVEFAPEMQFVLDSDFYLGFYPDLATSKIVNQVGAKLHWFRYGKNEGRVATAKQWADTQNQDQLLLDPSKLDFGFILTKNSGLSVTVRDILDSCLGNVVKPIQFSDNVNDTVEIYKKVGLTAYDHYKHRNEGHKLEVARSAWRIACQFKPSSEVLEILAGTFYAQSDYRTAQKVYEQAYQVDKKLSHGAVGSLLTCFEKLTNITSALHFLTQYHKDNPDQSAVVEWVDDFCQKLYLDNMGEMQVLANLNQRQALLDCAEKYVEIIYQSYFQLYTTTSEVALRNNLNTDRVLIVGDYHIPQCIRYRIDQKAEQLESQGKAVSTIDWRELSQRQSELMLHDVVIFYRVPALPAILKAIAKINANGKASFYEIDDLLFETSYPAPIETFGGYVDVNTHIELRKSAANFASAARRCRFGIASTKLLQERLAPLVQSGICLLHRNGLDKINYFSNLDKSQKDTVDIFYGSGTQAHNSDFIEQVLEPLSTVLTENKKVRLVIAGYLELPKSFKDQFASQLVVLPAVKSVRAYWSFLEKADINLAILTDDVINGCKSELKWFEAACMNVPSILSTTANYRDVINHGKDALLAGAPDQWTQSLRRLIKDEALRKTLAANALARVRSEYSVEALGQSLVQSLKGTLEAQTPQRQIKKKKIAIVNVFFPPQAIGGATRVVSDNIDELQKHHGDDFDLVVFTSDNHCTTPYQLSCYQHQGITVYRSTILYREHMDWHPKDDNMYKLFQQFLEIEKPDIVHFHCVQRLTASVIEATKDAEIPYFITAHDAWWISDFQFLVDQHNTVYPDGHPDIYAPRVLLPNTTLIESIERMMYFRVLLYGAKALLTVSEGFAKIYRKNGYDNIKVNKNGLSESVDWHPKDTAYTEKVVCAHIGGMAEHKGYFLLKDAIEVIQPKNIEMLIVDHSKEEGYVNNTQWGDVPVTFIGRIAQNQVDKLYQKLDVLFAPSKWPESYGLVTREAVACGCWVVASNMGGIGEDIEVTNGHRIKPDLESLSETIEVIDKTPKRYKGLSKSSKIRLVQKQVEELTGVYDS
ncbi:glycosyltransferase [Leucothrix arctica]|uniref:Glycosyl transferase family 1 n=1 Tax=Leucothrix arctica TaxID=1481894 RepID=A0A317CKF8_9GAMM|nr:glycosyltransferase [Leucothrix arctica]PWQ98819.1 glycosyl transferase family 1 [Leucothrix arctica]